MGKQLKHLGLAYIFLHIDFNILTINFLPNFVAYAMFIHILPTLTKYQKTMNLLKKLLYYLLITSVISWCLAVFQLELPFNSIINPLSTIISLYFHFQFLTDIYHIADDLQWSKSGSFLQIRTVELITTTVFTLFPSLLLLQGLTIIVIIILLIHLAWTYATFYDFGIYLEKKGRLFNLNGG